MPADTDGRSPRLRDYDAKRYFAGTPEPAGAAATTAADGLRFVVQRHRASRLHYDLRLELDGTLLSWAVPKGPTLDPGARRLAVQVEDHPIEYADLEGVIPAGEYGGGDVIVWDRGTWAPADGADPHRQIAEGSLHFDVSAVKLRGRFVLVRKGRGDGGGKPQWPLLHKGDDDAVEGWDPEEHPRSVLSGRTNEEVAAEPDLVWHSDRPADEAAEAAAAGTRRAGFDPVDDDELAALELEVAEGRSARRSTAWTSGVTRWPSWSAARRCFPGSDHGLGVTFFVVEGADLSGEWAAFAAEWIGRMAAGRDGAREGLLDDWMLEILGDVAGQKVIDLGCGEGRFCRMLAARGARTLGVDLQPVFVEHAAASAGPDETYQLGDMQDLRSVADGSFELALSYISLVDVPDQAAAVSEAFRVLVPGGRFVVCNLSPMATATKAGDPWVRDDGRKVHYVLDHYAEEGPRDIPFASGHRITNHHRMLSTTLDDFFDAGFQLRRLHEPLPTEAQLARVPDNVDLFRVPIFVIYELVKPAS